MAFTELLLDDLLPFRKAASILPGRPDISTLHRWRTKGVRGIRLATVRIGGRRYVSRDALVKFSEQITSLVDGETSPSTTPSVRRRAVNAAERELDARMRRAKPDTTPDRSPLVVVDSAQSSFKLTPNKHASDTTTSP